MIEKFSFEVCAPKIPPQTRLILVKDVCEHREHIVMKLLSYLLFYTPELKVEISADMHYKPDLMIPGDHGVPKLWIDCGQVAIKKIDALATKLKNTRVIFVKEAKRELDVFKKMVEKKIDKSERLEYLSFDAGFITSLGNSLKRTNHITLYEVMENVIGVALNDEIFESTLHR